MNPPNTAKSTELQVMIWFLAEGWEIFTPVSDLYGTDLVVRDPNTRRLLAVQVKHKQPGSLNEGRLPKSWSGAHPPFDFLVFYAPETERGLVIPAQRLEKEGQAFIFYTKDADGYSTGPVRPLFGAFAFSLRDVPHEQRASHFVKRFHEITSAGHGV